MARIFGPFTASAGSVQACALQEMDVAAVRVINPSRFDLAISFAPTQPPAMTALGGAPWNELIPAGCEVTLPLDRNQLPNGAFSGVLYVLPFDNSAALALSGTKSNNVIFYLATYGANEPYALGFAAAQFVNLASQPRVITVPVPAGNMLVLAHTYTSDQAQVFLGNFASFTYDGTFLILVPIYLMALEVSLRGVRRSDLTFYGGLYDFTAGAAVGFTLEELMQCTLWSGGPPPPPLPNPLALAAGTQSGLTLGHQYGAGLFLTTTSWPTPTAAFPLTLTGSMVGSADTVNTVSVPPIGQGAAFSTESLLF